MSWCRIGFFDEAFLVRITVADRDLAPHWFLELPAEGFRWLALWYLWRWAWGEWFGLRRRLYYWDLSRRSKALGFEKEWVERG